MTDGVTIILDDAELLAALDRTLQQLQQPRELLADIGAKLEANAQLRFETQTDPSGKPWAPLSPATRAIYGSDWFKARNPAFKSGIPGSLLERTRQLRNSLAFNAGDDFLEIGTSRATAGGRWQVGLLHEFGTRTMPRRGILLADPVKGELGADDQADVLAIINGALAAALFG